MFSRDANAVLEILFYVKLREVFTALKMKTMTEASKSMSEDQFYVRNGLNFKMQFEHAFLKARNSLK